MLRADHLANLWIDRKRPRDAKAVAAARARVAHLRAAVVVTGGSRGLGFAIARRFARAGRNIVILARGKAGVDEAVERLKADSRARKDIRITGFSLDVTDQDSAGHLEAMLAACGCYCDVLINNAGVGASGPTAGIPAPHLDALISLNIAAPTRLLRHFLPDMLARRRGGILNVASLGGAIPGPNQAAYYASKAYTLSFTQALASEISGQGVRVSALAPGPLDTQFHAAMGAQNSPYRQIVPAVSLERSAAASYWGFQVGRKVIVPGLLNSAFYIAVRLLPHPVTIPLMKFILRRDPL